MPQLHPKAFPMHPKATEVKLPHVSLSVGLLWHMEGQINEGLCVLCEIMNDVDGVFQNALVEWNFHGLALFSRERIEPQRWLSLLYHGYNLTQLPGDMFQIH